jgi:hypothetical protein
MPIGITIDMSTRAGEIEGQGRYGSDWLASVDSAKGRVARREGKGRWK